MAARILSLLILVSVLVFVFYGMVILPFTQELARVLGPHV